MLIASLVLASLVSVTGITITEPENMAAYNLDNLPGFRAIVENDNEIPDSVCYSLNGGDFVLVQRLSTDWPTYMQNYVNHGYSESPAPTDNTVLWTYEIADPYSHEFPTPVVVDGIVYYPQDHSGDSLYALDAASGELIWKYCVGTNDDAVTVQDGRLYAASDSIFCLDALTGERIWASGDADWIGSTPVVIDGKVFCGTGPYPPGSGEPNISYISCLDSSDGSNIWTTTLDSCAVYSCLAVWNQFVFMPTWRDGGVTSLYAFDKETGDVLWENDDSFEGYWDSSPVVVDSVIYINGQDGYTRGIDAVSGITIWEKLVYPATATSAYHDGKLYFATENSAYYSCIETLSGGVVWRTGGKQHGSSAVADGQVFYGYYDYTDAGIKSLDTETGVELWSYCPEGTGWIAGSPSVTDGVVYMLISDGNLYAFGTGLKYTYLDGLLNSQLGWNELIAASYDDGAIAASDTISFYINSTGVEIEPSVHLELCGYPNPFVSSTSISFSLADAGYISVSIFDLSGRIVSNLVEEILSAGDHTVNWNGCYQSGEEVSAGLYLCRIESGGVIETTGLCLLR